MKKAIIAVTAVLFASLVLAANEDQYLDSAVKYWFHVTEGNGVNPNSAWYAIADPATGENDITSWSTNDLGAYPGITILTNDIDAVNAWIITNQASLHTSSSNLPPLVVAFCMAMLDADNYAATNGVKIPDAEFEALWRDYLITLSTP